MLAAQMPAKGEMLPLPGPVVAGDPQEVIAANQDQRKDQARRATATPRTDADWYAEQREYEAGGGKRHAIVEVRRGQSRQLGPLSAKSSETERSDTLRDAFLGDAMPPEMLTGKIVLAKRGDIVAIGIARIVLVSAARPEVQLDPVSFVLH